jgi:DNA-binding NtrC family response regulator
MNLTDAKPEACVLVVEDEAALRDLVGMVIEDMGMKVTAVDTAEKGWGEILSQVPTLLVTDVITPGSITGWDLAWLAYSTAPDLRVIITSAFSDELNAKLPPSAVFLAKPWTIEQLYSAIELQLSMVEY